jgi:hypothetical protein
VTTPLGLDPRDPQAIQELRWRNVSVARTYAPRFLHAFGLLAVASHQPARIAHADDTEILEGALFAFDIAEEVGTDLDETVELALVVDPAVGRLLVAWDANAAPHNAMSVELPGGSGPWVTVEIPLERARFAGRGPRGTDVVVAAPGCDYTENAQGAEEMRLRNVLVRRPSPARAGKAPTARLELTLLDERGDLTAGRIGIYDVGSGREVLASADAVPTPRYLEDVRDFTIPQSSTTSVDEASDPAWPHANLWMIYAHGRYGVSVSPGAYEVVATHGPEYRQIRRRVEVVASQTAHVELPFERWCDLPAQGWWSGDAHVHVGRKQGGDDLPLSIARAEDVHVANLLAMGNVGAEYFEQRDYGRRGRASQDGHHIVSGQEDPRTGRRGHTLHLNIAERVHDAERYFLYHECFTRLRAGGAVSGYAHVGSDWFGENAGLALDVPFGIVDVVEVLQSDRLHTHPWYDFLDLGFRLNPIAGSDYPYIGLVGDVRSFAQIEGRLTPDAWFDAIRAGRTFVSNGPLLSFRVGEATMGDAVQVEPGGSLLLHAETAVNPDLGEVVRLELVVHGEVVASASGPGPLVVEYRLTPATGCWAAARTVGSAGALAHSAPVYVMAGGARHTWHAPSVPLVVDRMETLLRELVESTPDPAIEDFELWDVEPDYVRRWREGLPELRIRADEAIDRYERIRDAASRGN